MYIPYGRQWIDEDDIQAVVETLRSDYLTTGPKVEEFEQCVADYLGAKYAVAVSNGTAALHVACLAAGIGEGDEVITSPITFVASANCALYCGAIPVFADINPDTYNIDPEEIRSKITPRTKAIIPVHFTGQPCAMDEILAIAKEYNLIVIEDACHALGADYKGQMIGTLSDMTVLSFHPVKHITTGEG
ncbi:MAG: UDP-4-keto-6-deoxy-N-acetylglucosamine 4-aminotransferase, partial [Herbinix sp.]|nr:UDP-4-keto-6-deoxy-N-acetylglucosamine 4-aminotransferase [Herbinix sp.]